MSFRQYLLLAVAGILIAALFLLLPSEKTITLQIEGQPLVISTTARTVEQALAEAGFTLQEEDQVSPAPGMLIRDGETINLTQAMRVTLWDNGQPTTFSTTQRLPAVWLAQAGLTLGTEDRLLVNTLPHSPDQPVPFQPTVSVEVRRAVRITVESDGETILLQSSAATLGQALYEAGYTLTASDVLLPGAETPLEQDLAATWTPGRSITIQIGDQTIAATTSRQTVGKALAQAGLPLQGLDYSLPEADAPLPEDGAITLVRVTEEFILDQNTIPFTVSYQPLPEVEIDNFQVTQPGQVGIQAQRIRIRYEDGEETTRVVEQQWTLREPVTQIEGYGTMIVIRTEQTPDGPIEYWRKIEVWATSYSPCNAGFDYCSYTTSSGASVRKGLIAVKLDWYLAMAGDSVYVSSYGPAIIADVGPGWVGRYWIDVAYEDDEYIPWAKWVTLYFTTPVPPEDQIMYVLTTR
jgi:uncharacterized protein YabE (DUF348 family)